MNLQRHKALIESHANVLEIQAASTARELAEKAFQEAASARKDNQRIAVRTWLSARNVQLDHDGYTGVREAYPSTGLWVLQKTAIVAWHDNEHPSGSLVWIHGIPGAGMTQPSTPSSRTKCIGRENCVSFCDHREVEVTTINYRRLLLL
jgi:hypothetical protein